MNLSKSPKSSSVLAIYYIILQYTGHYLIARSEDWRKCPSLSPSGDWKMIDNHPRFIPSPDDINPYPSITHRSRSIGLSPLKHKWVYFYGDSTIRQFSFSLINATDHLVNYDFYKFRGLTRSKDCEEQKRSFVTVRSTCRFNEARCEFSPDKLGGYHVTFDWKHLAYEDYDEFLFREYFKNRKPAVFIFSLGLHDCVHQVPVEDIKKNSEKFFRLLNETYNGPVIWLDMQGWRSKGCTEEINEFHFKLIQEYRWLFFRRYPSTRKAYDKKFYRDHIHLQDKSLSDLFYILASMIVCALSPPDWGII